MMMAATLMAWNMMSTTTIGGIRTGVVRDTAAGTEIMTAMGTGIGTATGTGTAIEIGGERLAQAPHCI